MAHTLTAMGAAVKGQLSIRVLGGRRVPVELGGTDQLARRRIMSMVHAVWGSVLLFLRPGSHARMLVLNQFLLKSPQTRLEVKILLPQSPEG